MATFNTVPKTGTVGEAVDVINQNFTITSVAIGELEYATRKNKGLFPNGEALWAAIPHPEIGDWALVGEGFPAAVYACDTVGQWDFKSYYNGDNLDLNNYIKSRDFETLQTELARLNHDIENLDMETVKAEEDNEGVDLTLGGVKMRTKTPTQFAQMGGNYDSDTLYVVVEKTTT